MDTLALDCWVYGDASYKTIPVDISRTKTVGVLREVIKNEASVKFRDVDAHDLDLYSIPMPDDERFEATLKQWTYKGESRLNERRTLSVLNLSNSLVIVHAPTLDSRAAGPSVAVPDMTLNCLVLVRGEVTIRRIFPVKISSTKTVGTLKEAIKDKNSVRFNNVDARNLALYSIPMPDDERFEATFEQWTFMEHQSLDPRHKLSDLNLSNNLIVVHVPNFEHKRKRNEEEIEEDLRPPAVKLLKTVLGKGAPSSLALAARFCEIVGSGHAIDCNRPFDLCTIPLVLLHEAFGIFKDRCEAAPSEQALACLDKLTYAACKWYKSETDRRTNIQSVLQQHLDLRFLEQKVPGTEFMTDGCLIVTVMPAAIRECKNEHGDALSQAILFYVNFLYKALENPHCYYNCNTNFPSILIVDMGPYLGFYGAAWDGQRARVEPLTHIFDLSTHWRETKARHAIASSLNALMDAVRNIQAHYDVVEAKAVNTVPSRKYDPHLQKARRYPFMTSYVDNGQEKTFRYDTRLDDMKLVFSATLNQPNSDQILVKFTQKYSKAAHIYLSSRGSAPTLRQCVRVSAEWTAVIMDISKYRILFGLSLSKEEQEILRRKVRSEVQMLHSKGLVHGDIRDTNLLVDLDSLASDDAVVHLVDFDWAGHIGEARYPMGINTTTVKRPDGVKSGELITIQHDEDMISYLFE